MNNATIVLPKADKRFTPGHIKKDKAGFARGNHETVEIKYMSIPLSVDINLQMNPPMVVSNILAEHI